MLIKKSRHGVLTIEIREGKVARTNERAGDILVDLDEQGEVLCIELVGGGAHVSRATPGSLPGVRARSEADSGNRKRSLMHEATGLNGPLRVSSLSARLSCP